jgi:hypothetical protein
MPTSPGRSLGVHGARRFIGTRAAGVSVSLMVMFVVVGNGPAPVTAAPSRLPGRPALGRTASLPSRAVGVTAVPTTARPRTAHGRVAPGGPRFATSSNSHCPATADGAHLSRSASTTTAATAVNTLGGRPDNIGRWAKSYGMNQTEQANDVIPDPDPSNSGGSLFVGWTNSSGAGVADAWVVKLDLTGGILLQKTYGGTQNDVAQSVTASPDGTYVVAGWSYSWTSSREFWVLKLDYNLNVVWEYWYGGPNDDAAESIALDPAGVYYVVAGATASFGPAGPANVWVIKLDINGNVVWTDVLGGGGDDQSYSVIVDPDGHYVVAGHEDSVGGRALEFYLIKLSAGGPVIWAKTYGWKKDERALSVAADQDPNNVGGYVVAGWTDSTKGKRNIMVLKVTGAGAVAIGWPKVYVHGGMDYGYSILPSTTGYAIVGITDAGKRKSDAILLQVDLAGNIALGGSTTWTYGGGSDDGALAIDGFAGKDGGYVVAGYTNSYGQGAQDAWIFRMFTDGLFYDPGAVCIIQYVWDVKVSRMHIKMTKLRQFLQPIVPPMPTDAPPVGSAAVVNQQCGEPQRRSV